MNRRAISAIVLLPVLLYGCGSPVPADKADYVGEWRAREMYLLITQDGTVEYKRRRGGTETSISGPLRGFEGESFSVGLPLISTKFVVSKAPHKEGDRWRMVVDGVELARTR